MIQDKTLIVELTAEQLQLVRGFLARQRVSEFVSDREAQAVWTLFQQIDPNQTLEKPVGDKPLGDRNDEA